MNDKKQKETMYDRLSDGQKDAQIPFFAHEMQMARMDRVNKRLWIVLVMLIIFLVGTNAGWIIYESQFDDETYTYEVQQDSGDGGQNTYTGNTVRITGGDYSGEADGENNSQEKGTEDWR